MSSVVNNPVQAHEQKMVLMTANVQADGTIVSEGAGLTCTRLSAGLYRFTTKDQYPIYTTDLSDTNMLGNAFGTGVTKTFNASVSLKGATPGSTTTSGIGVSKPIVLSTNQLRFNVYSTQSNAGVDASFLLRVQLSGSGMAGK